MIAAVLITLLAVLLPAAPAWAAERAPTRSANQVLADAKGDVVDSNETALNEPRGDITQAAAGYAADSLRLGIKLEKFTDPLKDLNWNSDSTYVLWTLDTNIDLKPDYTVELGVTAGELYGAVFRASAPDGTPSICRAQSVKLDPSGVYVVYVDPGCIGRPDSVAWSVEMSYDTNRGKADAPATEDLAPDEEFAAPVFVLGTASGSGAAAAGEDPANPSTSTAPTSQSGAASAVASGSASSSVSAPSEGGGRSPAGSRGNGILSKQAARAAAAGIVEDSGGPMDATALTSDPQEDAAATAVAAKAAAGQAGTRSGGSAVLVLRIAGILALAIAGGLVLRARLARRSAG